MDLETLRRRVSDGQSFEYLMFYGARPGADGSIGPECLSQWYGAGFEVEGDHYPTAEHWMMAGKARLFDDGQMRAAILAASSPSEAKALGRRVAGFEQQRWQAARLGIVVEGNVAKFAQNAALGAFLVGTGDRVLVEAAPRDRIWGIGMGADHPLAGDPLSWRGTNLLGFALMEVRDRLRSAG